MSARTLSKETAEVETHRARGTRPLPTDAASVISCQYSVKRARAKKWCFPWVMIGSSDIFLEMIRMLQSQLVRTLASAVSHDNERNAKVNI